MRKSKLNYSRDVLLASYIGNLNALHIKPSLVQRIKRWIRSL